MIGSYASSLYLPWGHGVKLVYTMFIIVTHCGNQERITRCMRSSLSKLVPRAFSLCIEIGRCMQAQPYQFRPGLELMNCTQTCGAH